MSRWRRTQTWRWEAGPFTELLVSKQQDEMFYCWCVLRGSIDMGFGASNEYKTVASGWEVSLKAAKKAAKEGAKNA